MNRDELDRIRDEALAAIAAVDDLAGLDEVRAAHLGKRSELAAVQRSLGELAEEERREVGAAVNAVRRVLQEAEAARRAALEAERDRVQLAAEAVDVTLPPRTPRRGSLHPIHETMEAMVDAFVALGFRVVTGPEVETDWHNFEALNIPRDHPARSLWDTIYVRSLSGSGDSDTLLRAHTSPVQARVMLAEPPPVYVVVPGRTYRQDTPDATHLPVFHQIEGLAVDAHLSFADLRGTLAEFVKALFGEAARVRMRPDHFPFTEPSCEVDVWVPQRGRWMELLGAGMVHPNVLAACGYDPDELQGFAFGIGVERVAMIRHDIDDLRLFIENDLRFLAAF